MAEAIDCWLVNFDGCAMRDWRNDFYTRHMLTELGMMELSVPRTRSALLGPAKSMSKRPGAIASPRPDAAICAPRLTGPSR